MQLLFRKKFNNPQQSNRMKNVHVLVVILLGLIGYGEAIQAQLTKVGTNVYLTNAADKVGLGGITTPVRDLSVRGYVRASNDIAETEYVEMYHGGSHGFINTSGDGNLDFRHDGATKMSLKSNGYLGIGTINPANPLTVFKATNAWQIRFKNGASNVYMNHGNGSGVNINPGNSLAARYSLRLKGSSRFVMTAYNDGKVVIGNTLALATSDATVGGGEYLLFVRGGAKFEEVKVDEDWADYVFDADYELTSLEDVAAHIKANGHLHNTPSATEIAENGGVELGSATVNQQEKIEELFLHLIQMNEDIQKLKSENEDLKEQVKNLNK